MALSKYRLELHWESLEKNDDNLCFLYGAYFFGPALKIAQKINPHDNITLDLTPQYSKLITNYYFLTLSWNEVEYKDNKVYLKNTILKGDFVNNVSTLSNVDFIYIDTELHENEKHLYNLVYPSKIVNREGEEH